jgi:hypothetical protein
MLGTLGFALAGTFDEKTNPTIGIVELGKI